jgi:hypothetical protein
MEDDLIFFLMEDDSIFELEANHIFLENELFEMKIHLKKKVNLKQLKLKPKLKQWLWHRSG